MKILNSIVMKQKLLKLSPHLLITFIFVLVSAIYFFPIIEGKGLIQGDNTQSSGMSQELLKFEKNNKGQESNWTNSMFGGMPAYQIKSPGTFNIHLYLQRFLRLALPYTTMAILFIYLFGFYILLVSLDINKWLALLGAAAFALSSYNIIIIEAGHITKAYAIAYMAPVLAGTIMLYNKKYIYGGLLTAFALGMEIASNHPQITYYLAFMVAIYLIFQFVKDFKQKQLPAFTKASVILGIAVILAVLPNLTSLLTTYEYGKFSTRGQSELTKKQESSGLDKSYVNAWSYGIDETFTLLIPNFKGGASGAIGNNPTAIDKVKNEYKETIAGQNQYWGTQPFTSGPVYAGAIIFFLFILGLFIVKSTIKWWILATTLLSVMLSWGGNFTLFTDLFYNYFPMYNKFRSVSMTLVMASITMPLLAILAVKELINNTELIKKHRNDIFIAFAVTGGLALLFWIIPSITSFITTDEMQMINDAKAKSPQYAEQYNQIVANLELARQAIFRADAMRSFIFILLAMGTLLSAWYLKLKKEYVLTVLGLLIVADMWVIDRRYIGNDSFQKNTVVKNQFAPTFADEFITKDTDPNFRVLNLTRNVFNDGVTPYYHKSIGGYHGAKLERYQELIDYYLAPAVDNMYNTLKNNPDKAMDVITGTQVTNMLNTKYIIVDPNAMPLINMKAYGNAWFVSGFELVTNADEEIERLGKINPRTTAVINKTKFQPFVNSLPKNQIFNDDTSAIVLTSYKPNHLVYDAYTITDRLALFSEIYYPKGWNCYIDGKPVDHVNANYVLRAAMIPAGRHKVEFKFEPATVKTGKIIALISSVLLILLVAGVIFISFKNGNNKSTDIKA